MLKSSVCAYAVCACLAVQNLAAVTINFSVDDGGNTLVNGQSISTGPDVQDNNGNPDTVFEFGNLFNVSTLTHGSGGHEGAAIFDSTPGTNSADPDLWVDLGNVLILQNNDNPATSTDPTYGLVFDTPNDERSSNDAGSVVLDFLSPVETQSVTLIDIDGHAHFEVFLRDSGGNERHYDIPMRWTVDVNVLPGGQQPGGQGYQDLDLQTLLPQPSEPLATGGDATVVRNDAGYDPLSVVRLEILYGGTFSSGAIDNLTFIPEPAAMTLMGLGMIGILNRKRR